MTAKKTIIIISMAIVFLLTILIVFGTFYNKIHKSEITTTTTTTNIAPKTRSVIIDGKKRVLTYKSSNYNDDVEFDTYLDEWKNYYDYNHKTGNIYGFQLRNKADEKTGNKRNFLNEDQLKIKARDFVKNYIDLSQYIFRSFNVSSGYNYIQYRKIINGYDTVDVITVLLNDYGDVYAYASPNLGIFDNLVIPKIDSNKMLNNIYSYMNMHYGKVKVDIISKQLNINDKGKIVIEFNVNYNQDNQTFLEDIITGDIEPKNGQ